MSVAEKFEVIADEVYNKGKSDEYSAFWDSVDKNNIGAYNFSGSVWNDTTFKPKFDIVPTSCASFFANNNIANLTLILSKCGVRFDTSKSKSFGYSFYNCMLLETLPQIDYTQVTSTSQMNYTICGCSELRLIAGIKFPEEYTVHTAKLNILSNLPKLETIGNIEGKIKFNLDISKSTAITKNAIYRIVDRLYDYKTNGGNAFGATITLSDESKALIDDEMNTLIAQKGWEVL